MNHSRVKFNTSSPSFAHFKCCAINPELNSISIYISTGCSYILGVFSTCLANYHWCGNPENDRTHVDKLRTIQLVDPEFQINNKILGKRTLAHAEKANEVEKDQYGSRNYQKAISQDAWTTNCYATHSNNTDEVQARSDPRCPKIGPCAHRFQKNCSNFPPLNTCYCVGLIRWVPILRLNVLNTYPTFRIPFKIFF